MYGNAVAYEVLTGKDMPFVILRPTEGPLVNLSALNGVTVISAFPRISPAGGSTIPGWDQIPGAKGCTAQNCGFRDGFSNLVSAGVDRVYGLSTQSTSSQQEAVVRLRLPYPFLSDESLALRRTLHLPVFEAGGMVLLHRFVMVVRDSTIEHVIHSLDDTAKYADAVLAYLETGQR